MAVIALTIAVAGAYGVFLVVTAVLFGWRGLAPRPTPRQGDGRAARAMSWMRVAGIDGVGVPQAVGTCALVGSAAAALTLAVFGTPLPALAVGLLAASFPLGAVRARRSASRRRATEAWPRLLEEVALLSGSAGRSLPQALFEAGSHAGPELAPAFAAAHRHWLVTTDFARSLEVLTTRLADPTADAACETLLVAHEVGGSDVPARLVGLVEDRRTDVNGRKDAWARQAGVRFARRFVLWVPAGMALAGLSIGDGRAAYQQPGGQLIALLGVVLVALCWLWSGRILVLPEEERVFGG